MMMVMIDRCTKSVCSELINHGSLGRGCVIVTVVIMYVVSWLNNKCCYVVSWNIYRRRMGLCVL